MINTYYAITKTSNGDVIIRSFDIFEERGKEAHSKIREILYAEDYRTRLVGLYGRLDYAENAVKNGSF